MTALIRLALEDYLTETDHTLLGLLHYLIIEAEVPLSRIIKIAEKRFGIPAQVTLATIQEMFL